MNKQQKQHLPMQKKTCFSLSKEKRNALGTFENEWMKIVWLKSTALLRFTFHEIFQKERGKNTNSWTCVKIMDKKGRGFYCPVIYSLTLIDTYTLPNEDDVEGSTPQFSIYLLS